MVLSSNKSHHMLDLFSFLLNETLLINAFNERKFFVHEPKKMDFLAVIPRVFKD